MTIDAIENGTRVVTPEGWKGRVRVTRSERRVISGGQNLLVTVVSDGGQQSVYLLSELQEIVPAEPTLDDVELLKQEIAELKERVESLENSLNGG